MEMVVAAKDLVVASRGDYSVIGCLHLAEYAKRESLVDKSSNFNK